MSETILPENQMILSTDQNVPPDIFDVFRHNGFVTIQNPATGGHRTFRISTTQKGPYTRVRRISLLIGPENETDYKVFGFINSDNIYVLSGFGPEFKTYARMLSEPNRFQARGLVYLISGRCRRCNRLLTHPESIQTGLGPVCGNR